MKSLPALLTCCLLFQLTACTKKDALPCPEVEQILQAPSAGCLTIHQGKLLVVQEMSNKVSIPGGSANAGEAAHCAAHRETWEETGLNVLPGKVARVFDNGFHLFTCAPEGTTEIGKIPFHLEIQQAMWLSPEQFDDFEWRFPAQKDWLRQKMLTQE